jgi:MarR family transcriptional regulator, organic hydroperoxide resistance regulator
MSPTLQEEIRQSKPFDSLEEEVLLNLARTSAVLMHRMEQHFRAFDLTGTQYNVLRIVNGAGPCGISQCAIASRLVAETPDVPRLLKRTETMGLIERAADPRDKRVLSVHLTPAGASLLQQIAPHLEEISKTLFPNLTKPQLRTLNDLLNAAR